MYLIEIGSNGDLRLTNNLAYDEIPRYAILSHTWINDTEEVSFADMQSMSGRQKLGFPKLLFCAQQAQKDDLNYFWMDTCCIDRANSVELAEAINSMFNWYREAAKCYAYLSDVHIESDPGTDFLQSRWFTRGWTLQELLAPKWVEFFTSEGHKLGDRNSLEDLLSERTKIPVRALRGRPLAEFTIDERFGWMESRQTKREEDKAYGLLGIFNVYMTPIYAEGYNNAINRLIREMQNKSGQAALRSSGLAGVLFNSHTGSDFPTVSESKKGGLPLVDNNYISSIKPLEQEIERCEHYMGLEHPTTLAAVEKLGMVLQHHEDYNRAARQFRRTLKCREQNGDMHGAQTDLMRLAFALSADKEPNGNLVFGRQMSDYYYYTRPTGGSGGSRFKCIANPGFRVKRIKVWCQDSSISAIQLDYTDGEWSQRIGIEGGQVQSREILPGEVISELTIWHASKPPGIELIEGETIRYDENGRASSVRFSLGTGPSGLVARRFSNKSTGILVGIHGYSGRLVDSLGFVFLSPDRAFAHRPLGEILKTMQNPAPYRYGISHSPGLSYIYGAGGSGGGIFEDVAPAPAVIKELRFWTGAVFLRGVQVQYDDGTEGNLWGNRTAHQSRLTLAEGEFVTELVLSTNKAGDRMTRVEIKTNTGVQFASSSESSDFKPYKRDVKRNAALVGIYGLCGSDVDWLGFIQR